MSDFRPNLESTQLPAEVQASVQPPIPSLSVNPGDIGSVPTVYDPLVERNHDMVAGAAANVNLPVSDEDLLASSMDPATSHLLVGQDNHGTPVILGTVSTVFLSIICITHELIDVFSYKRFLRKNHQDILYTQMLQLHLHLAIRPIVHHVGRTCGLHCSHQSPKRQLLRLIHR